jgi:hypothetical protein
MTVKMAVFLNSIKIQLSVILSLLTFSRYPGNNLVTIRLNRLKVRNFRVIRLFRNLKVRTSRVRTVVASFALVVTLFTML